MKNMKHLKNNRIKISLSDSVYLGIVYIFLFLFTLIVLYPLIYVVSCSFSSAESLVQGQVFFLPVNPGLQGYHAVFSNKQVWRGYYNTIVYTALGTAIGVMVTITGSFVLSRKEFPMRNFITALFTVTMFFGGGMIPFYLLIKNLRLVDTIWAIVLPGAFNVWLGIVGRTFIQSTISEELFEATSLDGGSYFHFFTRVVLPLSKPILAVLALNFAVGHWNSYFNALIFFNDFDKFPHQLVLRNILISNKIDPASLNATDAKTLMEKQYLAELMKYSLIIVSSAPLLIVYPFVQKYFIKGVMVGSIKG